MKYNGSLYGQLLQLSPSAGEMKVDVDEKWKRSRRETFLPCLLTDVPITTHYRKVRCVVSTSVPHGRVTHPYQLPGVPGPCDAGHGDVQNPPTSLQCLEHVNNVIYPRFLQFRVPCYCSLASTEACPGGRVPKHNLMRYICTCRRPSLSSCAALVQRICILSPCNLLYLLVLLHSWP